MAESEIRSRKNNNEEIESTFDLYLAAILSLRFTPWSDGEGKIVFTLRKDFSGVLRAGEVDLDGVLASSVSPSLVFDEPCKIDLSGLIFLVDFSALC